MLSQSYQILGTRYSSLFFIEKQSSNVWKVFFSRLVSVALFQSCTIILEKESDDLAIKSLIVINNCILLCENVLENRLIRNTRWRYIIRYTIKHENLSLLSKSLYMEIILFYSNKSFIFIPRSKNEPWLPWCSNFSSNSLHRHFLNDVKTHHHGLWHKAHQWI